MARNMENARAWAQRPERKEYAKRWQRENKDKRRAYAQKHYYAHRAKNVQRAIDFEKNRKIRLAGRPKPPICEMPGCGGTGVIAFDHCHDTGIFRAWLCTRCNRYLGWVENNWQLVETMQGFLREFWNGKQYRDKILLQAGPNDKKVRRK